MQSVSIVIPNWNGRELLEQFFASVVDAAEQYRTVGNCDAEVIVVDDASTDGSLAWLNENYGRDELVKTIQNKENLGFLRTVNKGFESAKHRIVFLLNSDVLVELDCIAPLVRSLEGDGVFAVCCHANRIGADRLDGGGKIGLFERGFWRVFLNYDVLPGTDGDLISFFGSGGYTAFDRNKWDQLGGFQECLSPNYWEDVEISYRAWKRGWKVLYEPTSIVHHVGSVSTTKSRSKDELDIVSERNRLLMTWINLHDKQMFASHVGWVVLKLLGSAVSFKWNFLQSFIRALEMSARVRVARSIEKDAAVISDRELENYFQQLLHRPDINVLDSSAAELALADRKKSIAKPDNNVG